MDEIVCKYLTVIILMGNIFLLFAGKKYFFWWKIGKEEAIDGGTAFHNC
jgi:hypothetical protein